MYIFIVSLSLNSFSKGSMTQKDYKPLHSTRGHLHFPCVSPERQPKDESVMCSGLLDTAG